MGRNNLDRRIHSRFSPLLLKRRSSTDVNGSASSNNSTQSSCSHQEEDSTFSTVISTKNQATTTASSMGEPNASPQRRRSWLSMMIKSKKSGSSIRSCSSEDSLCPATTRKSPSSQSVRQLEQHETCSMSSTSSPSPSPVSSCNSLSSMEDDDKSHTSFVVSADLLSEQKEDETSLLLLSQEQPQNIESHHHHVRFGSVSIRSYAQVLGDHPCCSMGCPLELGWAYQEEPMVLVDDLEELHQLQLLQQQQASEDWGIGSCNTGVCTAFYGSAAHVPRLSPEERRAILQGTVSDQELRRVCRRRNRCGSRTLQAFFATPCEKNNMATESTSMDVEDGASATTTSSYDSKNPADDENNNTSTTSQCCSKDTR